MSRVTCQFFPLRRTSNPFRVISSTMASARPCSTCKEIVACFVCVGCREIFCLKHCNDHRQDLENQLNQLTIELDMISQQVQDEVPENESLKERLYEQINDWKDRMIEQMSQKAEEVRRQVDELLNMKDVKTRAIQILTNELETRKEKQNFFEDDLRRIEEDIQDLRQFLDQIIQQLNIELHTEQIDWENVISIQDSSSSTSASVTDKPNGRRNSDTTSNGTRYASTLWRPPMAFDQQILIPTFSSYAIGLPSQVR